MISKQVDIKNELPDDLWIVIPAYNEETAIGIVLHNLKKVGFTHLLVVNDGSADKTSEVAQKEGAIVLRHAINRGYGAALKTGFLGALRLKANWVVTCDADGQHLAEDVLTVAKELIISGNNMVIGSRYKDSVKQQIPLNRVIYTKTSNKLNQILNRNNLSDSQSGLRGYDRRALECMDLSCRGMGCSLEILKQVSCHKLKIGEIPIKAIYTKYSMSKGQSFSGGLKTVFGLIMGEIAR